ncbi:hypothetical protein BKA63DRAFT_491420 [Paraphoma chrysanthemicola]|nr:hypothetical protein BKA63DRAFT_491420 [Paraphoma chrysanthemicola]
MAARSAVAGHTQSQVQSYGEAGDRALSPGEPPEPLAPVQSLTERILQRPSVSTASPQQMRESRRDSDSLFVGLLESVCELEARDSRSCGVVLASQNNDVLANNTTTTPKEASSSNQQNSATVNGAGDADEDLSAKDPAAVVLQHNSHAQSLVSIETADTVRTIQPLQLELAERVQDGGCQESETPESPTQEEPELLKSAGQERQEGHARILEEKELLPSVLFAIEKPPEVGERQEMHGEPEILGSSPFALANGTIYRPSELSAEAESVLQPGTWRRPVLQEAALALPSGESVEGKSQALVISEQLPGRLSEDHEPHEEVVIQRVPAEPDVCDGVDEPTMLLARSERSISSSPQQSRLTVQHTKECTHTLPVSSTENSRTEPSATSLTLRLDPKNMSRKI